MAGGRLGRAGLGLRLLVLYLVSAADQSPYFQPSPPKPGWYVYACPNGAGACDGPVLLQNTVADPVPECHECLTVMESRQILSGWELRSLHLGQTIWVCVRCHDRPPVRTGQTAPTCPKCQKRMKRFSE